jgi:hypothetical protein
MFRYLAKLLAVSLLAAAGTIHAGGPLDGRLGGNYAVPQSLRDCDTYCPEMVIIRPGRFAIGSPMSEVGRGSDENPQRV